MASANNAKKGANVRMKRKERKNIAAGQAHIQSTLCLLDGQAGSNKIGSSTPSMRRQCLFILFRFHSPI